MAQRGSSGEKHHARHLTPVLLGSVGWAVGVPPYRGGNPHALGAPLAAKSLAEGARAQEGHGSWCFLNKGGREPWPGRSSGPVSQQALPWGPTCCYAPLELEGTCGLRASGQKVPLMMPGGGSEALRRPQQGRGAIPVQGHSRKL